MSRKPNIHGFPASSAALPRVIKHGRSKDFSKGGQTVTIVMITTTPCFISNARRDGGGGGVLAPKASATPLSGQHNF